jgi:cytochrome P450
LSNIPYLRWTITGQLHHRIRKLHEEYGEVVRIRPNALTYRSPQAWSDIYGHRTVNKPTFPKDPEFYIPAPSGLSNMINANEADHMRQKRLLTYAFSERAMRDQEPLIQSYIDLFITKLREHGKQDQRVNIDEWLNFLTFDITGDLAFGEPFGCLRDAENHLWVAMIFQSIKTGTFLRALSVYPLLAQGVRKIMPARLIQKRVQHYQMSKERVNRRLAIETSRPDFISYILRHNDERGMHRSEIETNAALLIQAGSETTATVLSAAVYYLGTHPVWKQKLKEEVRTAFPTEASITFQSASHLPFLNAVIEESLRLFPPTPGIGPRIVPPGGASIDGNFVPQGVSLYPLCAPFRHVTDRILPPKVSVSVAHLSTYRSRSNFADPDGFRPERWLDGNARPEEFAADRQNALQPFSYGPRACIGRKYALFVPFAPLYD